MTPRRSSSAAAARRFFFRPRSPTGASRRSRLALLNNPMAMQMMKQMPGFEEIINDKEKFLERMLQSKAQFDAMRETASKESKEEAAAAAEFDD